MTIATQSTTINGTAGNNNLNGGSGNDVINGGAGNDDINGGSGNDVLDGGTGNDELSGGSGNDVLLGGAGSDELEGGSGNDDLDGGSGNDELEGGSGNDTLDGGSGSDELEGGSGNDTFIYNISENSAGGTRDIYIGDAGADTVLIEFTRAEWMNSAYQTQIANYLSWLTNIKNNKCGNEGSSSDNYFTMTFDHTPAGSAVSSRSTLTIKSIENLRVTVDGVELNPKDELVTAVNDVAAINEKQSSILIAVLDNDTVPDLVKNLELLAMILIPSG